MITVTCPCKQPYNIEETNMPNKEKIVCPNCEKELPQDVLQQLKAISIHQGNVRRSADGRDITPLWKLNMIDTLIYHD